LVEKQSGMSIRSRGKGRNISPDPGGPALSAAVSKKSALAASLLLSFILAVNLFAQIPSATDQPPNSIRGIVINGVTNEPIGRALVSSSDRRFATMTDAQGYFEFKLPPTPAQGTESKTSQPNRPLDLTARKPGYIESFQSSINIGASPDPSDLKIVLTPEALITGRVISLGSDVEERIQVELYRRQSQNGMGRWILAGSTSTRHNEEFRFSELMAGEYKLLSQESLDRDPLTFDPKEQLYGYPPSYFPNASDFASGKLITIAAGSSIAADITVSRQPYYPVKIKVLNAPAGTGLAIDVWAAGRPGPGFSLGYNLQTQTIEGLLPNGNYLIEASSFSQIGVNGSTTISVKGSAATGSPMALLPNSSIGVEVKEEFTTDDNVSGQVTFSVPRAGREQRGPRSYLNVLLESADDFGHARGGFLRKPTVPADESLAIDSVQPGRYWVTVQSSRGFASSITSGAIDLKHSPLIVGAGGQTSPIEITMRNDSAELDGSIEGANKTDQGPKAHVFLVPLTNSSGDFREIWVGPDGKFQSEGIPPGTYQALAFATPTEIEYRNSEAVRAYESKGIVIHFVAGQKENVKLHLISPGE
jgi:hypothetical protein